MKIKDYSIVVMIFKEKAKARINKTIDDLITILKAKKLKKSSASYHDILGILIKEFKRDNVNDMAKSMAFSFILAVFPGIIFLFTLIPYIPISGLNDSIMLYLSEIMPGSLYEFIAGTVKDIISKKKGELLSFSFIFALFSSTNGSLAMIQAFNKVHNAKEKRSFIKTRLTALAINIVLTLVLVLSVFAIIIGNLVLDYLMEIHLLKTVVGFVIKFLNLAIIICAFFSAISFIYYAAPVFTKKWRFFSQGAFLATILIVLFTGIFSIYINNFSNFNTVYGSIGTIIVLMLWMYAISLVILIGFELNSSLETARRIFARNK